MIKDIESITDQFISLNQVEAIVLGGSQATGNADSSSDIDLYIYVNERINPQIRENFLNPYCRSMEIANTYWEEEDDVILHDGTVLEIIYRDLKSFVHGLNRVAYEHIPSNSYSTCSWYSLIHSNVLYEKNQLYSKIQERYTFTYPDRLAKQIIEHGLPLLTGSIPSYDTQIIKAFKRGDIVSVNHRITEFLATYFDLLFAINHMLHPGEKRMVEHLKQGKYLPHEFEKLLDHLIHYNHDLIPIEKVLQTIIKNLHDLIHELNY
jgi:predicted nucleotidyltransferase